MSLASRPIRKVVFIEPRSPDYHVFSRWGLPRLGCVLLATILKKNGIDATVYVEAAGSEINLRDVLSADAVGITTITSTAPRAYGIADVIREKGIPVFMGGPHVNFLPEEALEHADVVMRGEAEDTILPFLAALGAGSGLEKIPGLSMKVDGGYHHSPAGSFCKDLDALPFPDFSLIQGVKKFSVTPVMTSRGCPYDCTFCSVTGMFGHRHRFMSPRRVVDEMKQLTHPADPNWVFFYDDIFNAHPKRTKDLLRLMIAEGVTPQWTAQVRVEVAQDDEFLDLMERSKCFACYVGLESINPLTLQAYNKKQTEEDVRVCVEKLHDHGIRVHGMFVFGSDEDDVSTIRETAKFAKRNRIDTVQFMILTPLPGSRYYEELNRQDRLLTKDWSLYDAHHVVYDPGKMSVWELQSETFRALAKFYSPWQIVRKLFKLDIYTSIMRAYGRRIILQWRKTNRDFLEAVKDLKGGRDRVRVTMDSFSERLKILESAAKRAAQDIRVRMNEASASLRVRRTEQTKLPPAG